MHLNNNFLIVITQSDIFAAINLFIKPTWIVGQTSNFYRKW